VSERTTLVAEWLSRGQGEREMRARERERGFSLGSKEKKEDIKESGVRWEVK
jgi:hypothetical protein